MALTRDVILELLLGPPTKAYDTETRRNELRQHSEETYLQLPVHTLYKVGDKERSPTTAFLFSLQLALYRELLLNKILLDRLPGYGSFEIKQSLIETARKMLDAILLLAANRDKLTDFTMGFITYSGIPPAAILSVELLKQSKFPRDCRLALPRPEVIQNLNILMGCLEWVQPTEGTRKAVERILKQVLDRPPGAVKTTICLILPHLKLPSPRLDRQKGASFLGMAGLGRLD